MIATVECLFELKIKFSAIMTKLTKLRLKGKHSWVDYLVMELFSKALQTGLPDNVPNQQKAWWHYHLKHHNITQKLVTYYLILVKWC